MNETDSISCAQFLTLLLAVGMGQRSSLFKIYLTTTHRLLEVLFAKILLGVPIGYAVPRGTDIPGREGWAVTAFDNMAKMVKRQEAQSSQCIASVFPVTKHIRSA